MPYAERKALHTVHFVSIRMTTDRIIFCRNEAARNDNGSRKDGGTMDTMNREAWETMTTEERRRALYDRQAALLKTLLEHGAISQQQHDKSLHDLTVKMGYE